MITVHIDNKKITVTQGTTILAAARIAGSDIPTMCHRNNLEAITSCMICVVEVQGTPFLVPSCSALVVEGMVIETNNDRVREAQKNQLRRHFSHRLKMPGSQWLKF